jgi:leucyl-tRNA synthetase
METIRSKAKLNYYLELESKMQNKWQNEKIFEVDASESNRRNSDEKFLGTFPFPYPNGRIHIGHTFSLSKLEVNTIRFNFQTILLFQKYFQ